MIKPSKLRANIYKLLDQVAETGIPLEILRKGKKLKIVSEDQVSKIKSLKKRKIMNCEPEEFVSIDWSGEWKG